jgi:hypothetical protein
MASSLIRLSVFACDMVNMIDSLKRISNLDSEFKLLDQATAINRLAMLGFTAAESCMRIVGAKSESLAFLKQLEILPRTFNFPLQFMTEVVEGDISTAKGVFKIVERGVVAPIAGIFVTAAEQMSYYERQFLEMTPEQRISAKRPILEYDPENEAFKITGYKPVEIKECLENIKKAAALAKGCAALRVASETGSISKATFEGVAPFYQYLASYLTAMPRRNMIPVRGGVAPAAAAQGAQQPQRDGQQGLNLDFLAFDSIPIPLHEDVVFKRFICPITNEPVRDPVKDPNGITIYERRAIYQWIAVNPVSPMTRAPLTRQLLIEVPAVKALIDHRLQFHRDRMIEVLQQGLDLPVVDIEHQAALIENGG